MYILLTGMAISSSIPQHDGKVSKFYCVIIIFGHPGIFKYTGRVDLASYLKVLGFFRIINEH